MIPLALDIGSMLSDLNRWGWRDYKIEIACELSKGYVAQLRCGNIARISYPYAARLYNFWYAEAEMRALPLPALQNHLAPVTT